MVPLLNQGLGARAAHFEVVRLNRLDEVLVGGLDRHVWVTLGEQTVVRRREPVLVAPAQLH